MRVRADRAATAIGPTASSLADRRTVHTSNTGEKNMAKAQLAQTKANAEFAKAREQFKQLQEQMDDQNVYVGADTSVANTLSAVEEAAIEAERLAGAILWRLKGPQAQELGASAPDGDNIESRLGAVHTKLQSINDDLRASADTLGA